MCLLVCLLTFSKSSTQRDVDTMLMFSYFNSCSLLIDDLFVEFLSEAGPDTAEIELNENAEWKVCVVVYFCCCVCY